MTVDSGSSQASICEYDPTVSAGFFITSHDIGFISHSIVLRKVVLPAPFFPKIHILSLLVTMRS